MTACCEWCSYVTGLTFTAARQLSPIGDDYATLALKSKEIAGTLGDGRGMPAKRSDRDRAKEPVPLKEDTYFLPLQLASTVSAKEVPFSPALASEALPPPRVPSDARGVLLWSCLISSLCLASSALSEGMTVSLR